MTSGVYAITNTVNGHRYVGSAMNIAKRWRGHRASLGIGIHGNRHLQYAWDKYGKDVFRFEVLEECEICELIGREQWWMDVAQPEYNIARVAGSSLGITRSLETRAKIGAASKGRSIGRKHSAEELARTSASQKGRTFTAETRAKMSAAAKGKIISAETRCRLRAANMGKKMSPEATAKTAARTMGKQYFLGHKHTPETRVKMSVAAKRRYAKKEMPT